MAKAKIVKANEKAAGAIVEYLTKDGGSLSVPYKCD